MHSSDPDLSDGLCNQLLSAVCLEPDAIYNLRKSKTNVDQDIYAGVLIVSTD